MRIYLKEDKSDYIDLIAMVAKVNSKSQHEKEKRIGLEILGFTETDNPLYYKINEESAFKLGMSESLLLKYMNRYLNQKNEYITLHEFKRNRQGNIYLTPIKLKNSYSESGRSSRRYLLVNYKGKMILTDVLRLNLVTKHYKANRERNERGLEWENYFNILASGGAFNMSYS